MSMKRRQLKIKWEPLLETASIDGVEVGIPIREPDTVHNQNSYWFNEMRCRHTVNGPGSVQHELAWIMDECPRTGALMVFNPYALAWYIQPKPVFDAYVTWLAEHHFME